MPTVQTTDDFNHNIDAGYYNTFWGGPPAPSAVTSPIYQSQPKSLLIPGNGDQNRGVRTLITGGGTKGWMGWAFRFEANPTVTDVLIGTLVDAAGTQARFSLPTNGSLYAYVSGGSTVSYSGNPMTPDTWYWLEAIFDVDDGTGVKKLYWRVNGVDQTTATFSSAASTIAHGQILAAFAGGTCDFYTGIWKLGVPASVSDWLGEPPSGPTLDNCLPDADITTTGWATAPLFSKINDASDATVIQATAS